MLGLKRQSKSSSVFKWWKSACWVLRAKSRSLRTFSSSWRSNSRNSSWARRLAVASCSRRLKLRSRPESRSCLQADSMLGWFIVLFYGRGFCWGEAHRDQVLIGVQIANERMTLDKSELLMGGGLGQQFLEITQVPAPVRQCRLAGPVQLRHRMLFRQRQKTL